ncbi:MAG: alpha/beta fold hydrolase [Actinomycetales bacterium]|nr:alpha/beta fold hydrolase [Actinomycetales bacterium]
MVSEVSVAPAERLTLTTADGTAIAATRYAAGEDSPAPRGVIVVGGASAVPQRYYRRFAEAAVARGYTTFTLDYRGIGDSAPENLRGYRMDFRDWARQDLSAAIDRAAREGLPVFSVGHSYGGSAFGLMARPERVRALYSFGSGTGWAGWMPRAERLRVYAMWNLVGPVATRVWGYLPWSRFMSGEDVPTDAYRDWKRWCSYPRFVLDDPETPEARESFAAVRIPIVSVAATDDRWAPPASRDALLSGYTGAPVEAVDVTPAELGVEQIGHMGYFRPFAAALWEAVFDRFDALLEAEPA